MKTVAAFGLSLLVAGCVNLNPYQQPLKVEAGPEPTKAELEPIALHVLQGLLKDPDSEAVYVETENSVYRLTFHQRLPLAAAC